MYIMMPGYHDSFAHRTQLAGWGRSERLDYCDQPVPHSIGWSGFWSKIKSFFLS